MSDTVTIPADEYRAMVAAIARADCVSKWLDRAQATLARHPDWRFARSDSEAAIAAAINLSKPQNRHSMGEAA